MCLFFSVSILHTRVPTFLIIKQEREREGEKGRDCKAHDTRVTSPAFDAYTTIYNHFLLLSPFRRIFFFLFDTHTVSWLLRVDVCIDVFFLSSRFSNAHTYTYTHISKSSFVFFALFSLSLAPHCLLASSRVFLLSFFFSSRVRAWSRVHVLLLLFLLLLFLQCQHHERRPTDRQSTTTCFAQLKESNGSSGNSSSSSKTRNNYGSNNFSFNL